MAKLGWTKDEWRDSWVKDEGWKMFHENGGFDEIDIDPRIEVTTERTCNGEWKISAHLKDDLKGSTYCDAFFDLATKDRESHGMSIIPHGMSIIPKRILRSGDRTIVFWEDGTKTIVKRAEDEPDNDYTAFTAAFAIKLFGSNSALKRMIDKKLEYQKTKTEKKESPLHAEPVVDAVAKIGATVLDNLVKKATELAESIGRRIVIDVGPVVEEDDKK